MPGRVKLSSHASLNHRFNEARDSRCNLFADVHRIICQTEPAQTVVAELDVLVAKVLAAGFAIGHGRSRAGNLFFGKVSAGGH